MIGSHDCNKTEHKITSNQKLKYNLELLIIFFISFSGTVTFTTGVIIPNECLIISKCVKCLIFWILIIGPSGKKFKRNLIGSVGFGLLFS